MTKEELLADIAKGRSIAQRLPLYEAAMNLHLLTLQDIGAAISDADTPKPKPTKKAVAKKAEPSFVDEIYGRNK